MTEGPVIGVFAGIGVGLVLGVLLWMAASIAGAQPDHVILARICTHEAGMDSPADCQLVHTVIAGIAERDGVTFRQAARLASPRLARCAVRRAWVCGLREDGARPPGFPARWGRYRERWLAVLEVCRRLLRGEQVAALCAEVPRVWGSVADVRRGRARGHRWVDAECPGTRNRGGRWVT